ncbi:DEAD/DEAH box helicase [Nocardia aurantiaca]|uniref:DEAD/DEAH box helicase n=1 Tax=Nocardia aurantiaca TaxID=2675850 RepID=A0A6I3KWP6_9NOCA|nr:DEAD/DEAH box helicase [Nocardia aurantiaca]MTE15253.1 DEAD/DEAH box helicase [Nocardia aurantiaca]
MNSSSFAALGVREPLVRALTAADITEPFPIQADTLPDSLAGRDVLGRGKTGSGKTLAFSIPMVDRLGARSVRCAPNHPAGLVLAPTRELATQIAATLEPLVAAYRMSVTTIFGGVSQHRQVRALERGVDIVIACPGRLEDLMRQGLISLDAVEITIIDEADHMADLGFLPGVTRILAATPDDGQRLLFSATLDNGVNKLVQRFLPNAVKHAVDEANSPVAAMTHHIFEVPTVEAKRAVVHRLASGAERRILFTRTKHQARKLARQLTAAGIPAVDLHGNLTQPARDRNLATFASGAAKVLVATDVAARGVHVDGVELVVHVDPPAEHKAYLHRSGRTARAGNHGDVITLVLPDQRSDLAALLRRAKITATPQPVTPDSPQVTQLIGAVASLVALPEADTAAPRRANTGPSRARGPRRPQQRTHAAATDANPASARGRRKSGPRAADEARIPDRPAPRKAEIPAEGRPGRRSGTRAAGKPRAASGSPSSGGHDPRTASTGDKSPNRNRADHSDPGPRQHERAGARTRDSGGRTGFARTDGGTRRRRNG